MTILLVALIPVLIVGAWLFAVAIYSNKEDRS